MLELGDRIRQERDAKAKQVEWLRARRMVNDQTGEVLSDREGAALTLEEISRSWYTRGGARQNVAACSRRAAKALSHPADVGRYRPKLLTLTFADVQESWEIPGVLSRFTNSLQHWAKRHGAVEPAYMWVDEVQMKTERGAAHYHLLLIGFPFIPKGELQKLWTWGFLDVRAFDQVGRALSYLKKYLWKWADVDVDVSTMPDWWFYYSIFAKRRFGFSRWFSFAPIQRIPSWLREAMEGMGFENSIVGASRMVGGGWLVQLRGSVIADDLVELRMHSPWKVSLCPSS